MATRWLALRLDFVSFCIITGVSFLVVATASANTDLSALALMYSLQFIGSLQWTVRLFIDTETNMTSVERVHHYSTIPQEAPSEIEGSVPSEEWPKEGAIEFNNLKIRYRPELDLVLKGVTAKIKPREKIGICGRTGAGKSSLMVALFRIVEAELDNESPAAPITIDGVDISRVGLRDLRKHLSIIPQDPVLFSGTVRYNLDPFDEYTDAQLWQALRDVHLVDTIQGLPHQLSHVVSEFGDNFSHGQRQLICIARALLRRSRIVVMDEATASVDAATDQLIQQTIRELFRDCTVLTVAHRLDTIIQCDRIMVLDSGRILEFDTPAQLLASDQSVFREMVSRTGADMQKKLYAAANL